MEGDHHGLSEELSRHCAFGKALKETLCQQFAYSYSFKSLWPVLVLKPSVISRIYNKGVFSDISCLILYTLLMKKKLPTLLKHLQEYCRTQRKEFVVISANPCFCFKRWKFICHECTLR